jgi:hypothetical protein
MDRRFFLKSAGAVTIMVAGGQVWRAVAQDSSEIGAGPEFEPWRTWNEDAQVGSLAPVRAAILCANCFNTQPWLFKVFDQKIEIYADSKRNLGAFDPYLREMHFSLGCALENLSLTAEANGKKPTISYVSGALKPPPSDGAPELAATVDLARGAKRGSELYDAIPHRHTNRNRYDPQRPLPPEFTKQLETAPAADAKVKVFTFVGPEPVAKVADAVADATAELNSDPDVRKGTQPWIRTTREQQRELRDGSYVEAGADSRATPDAYRNLMKTAALFGLIAVRDRYDREQTMRAGRVWQRAHLLATARHIAARPANGSIELIDHQRDRNQLPKSAETLAKFTGDAAWQPTFMFYMGYALRSAPASPRRGIDQVRIL